MYLNFFLRQSRLDVRGHSGHRLRNVEKCFSLVRTFREKHPNVPLSLTTYVNIAVAPGRERCFQSAAAAGLDATTALRDLPLAMR